MTCVLLLSSDGCVKHLLEFTTLPQKAVYVCRLYSVVEPKISAVACGSVNTPARPRYPTRVSGPKEIATRGAKLPG